MSRVHPIQRARIALAVFAFCGLALGFSADPVRVPETPAPALAPLAVDDVDVATPARRAWREQLPAIIVVRRARPS